MADDFDVDRLLGNSMARSDAKAAAAEAQGRRDKALADKAEHEAELKRREATFDDVLMTANAALRALDRVACAEDLQAWRTKHADRLGALRPKIAEYMNDVSADLPWEEAREEHRDLLFAARDTYQRPA